MREGYVLTHVCPSIHLSVCPHLGGGTPARSSPGGTPSWIWLGGISTGGTLTGGTPPQVPPPHQTLLEGGTLLRGTSPWVSPLDLGDTLLGVAHLSYPHWTWWGGTPPWVPPIRPGWGYPNGGAPIGVPHLGYPPSDLARWVPHQGVAHLGYPPIGPGRGTPMGGYPTSGRTWYAAVGMPLAFTQEDFLVAV